MHVSRYMQDAGHRFRNSRQAEAVEQSATIDGFMGFNLEWTAALRLTGSGAIRVRGV